MRRAKGSFRGLRFKAIFMAVAVCVIGISISNYYVSVKAKSLLYRYKLERMDALGRIFASDAEHGVLTGDRTIANKVCYGVTKEQDVLFAIVFDADKNIFAGNYEGIPKDYFSYIKKQLDEGFGVFGGVRRFIKGSALAGSEVMIQPIFSDKMETVTRFGFFSDQEEDEKEVIGYSVIVFSLKNINQEIKRVRMMIGAISVASLLAIVVFFYVLVNMPIGNLRRLLDATEKLGAGDLSARVDIRARDEIGELAEGFNKMAEDLDGITVSRDLLIKETAAREKAQEELHQQSLRYEKELEKDVAEKTKELKEALERNKKASLETIYRLSLAAEYRDMDTGSHLLRMSRYTQAIARKMGLDNRFIEAIMYAALMHDVGKIGISDSILQKPEKLTDEEWDVMKRHTTIGARILKDSEAEYIKLARDIALTHHEWWDGTGYPSGLKGEEIALAGRITAIADVFDAVTSKRPYKEAFPVEVAFDIIREGRGTHFDPKVVDAFFEIKDEILKIKNTKNFKNDINGDNA